LVLLRRRHSRRRRDSAAMGSGGDSSGSDDYDADASDELEDSSDGDSSCESDAAEIAPPQRLAFVVMTCVISGYTLIGPLQHDLKHALHVSDAGAVNEMFIQSVALVQWGKTFMTLGQNVLLGFLTSAQRVYVAMCLMFFGVLIPPLMIFTFGSLWLGWVPLAYGSIGLALGVFECTFLSVISPLGPLTKSWAIMGFPAAFFIVNVFFQSLRALFNVPVVISFWYVALCLPVGILCFKRIAPKDNKVDGKSYRQANLSSSLREWNSWLPKLLPFALVNIACHFVMESVLPAVFNTYNAKQVSLLGPENTTHLMKTEWFLVIFSFVMGIGDIISRRLGYCFDLKTTSANYLALAFAFCCTILGLILTIQGIAALTWFSAFLAFFGNGFNYAVTSKYIDKFVPRKHNLAAYSVWMCVGYCGAIAGAVLVSVVKSWICGGKQYEYQCSSGMSQPVPAVLGNATGNWSNASVYS